MAKINSSTTTLGWGGLIVRLLAAFVLVLATYNPEGKSYYHWVSQNLDSPNAIMAFAGVALLIGWAIFIRATLRSLGVIGVALTVAFFGTLGWFLIEQDIISLNNIRVFTYIILIMVSLVIGIGMSWSFIRRRMTGQLDVDDVD
ncbi:MAG TPA: hypothetical protein ENI80_08915 [Acidiferrobacteraceae bacterium]|nr:hypothetical protein [Acidiferrobacteraceae bacterium]